MNSKLVPDQPRSWFHLFMASGGFVALALTVFVIASTIMGSMALREAAKFEQFGEWTTATISERRVRRDDDDTDYLARFDYSVDGVDISSETNVGRSYYRAHPEGTLVEIKYLPSSPRRFEFKEGSTRSAAKVAQVMALLLGLGALAAIWFPGYKAARAVLARRYGRSKTAQVIEIVEIRRKSRSPTRGYIIFEDEEGRTGKSFSADLDSLRAMGVGAQISIFVRGNDIWWEGDTGPRARVPSQLPKVSLPPDK